MEARLVSVALATAALLASKIGLSLRKPYQPHSLLNAALGTAEDCLALSLGRSGLRQALGESQRRRGVNA